jgi:galactokinase
MTGAGFGGCAVALVQAERAASFADDVESGYSAATNLRPAIYVCRADDGASVASAKRTMT